ncbi:MAG: cytochrome-c peroxidase [Planctomycetota bacterium]
MPNRVAIASATAVIVASVAVLRWPGDDLAPMTPPPGGASAQPEARQLDSRAIVPIPLPPAELDARTVALGRRLFHEERLSADGTISCASCHALDEAGADGRRASVGVGGAVGDRNAPTVLNSALNFTQFWDGRARTLEEQVGGPLTHPSEMGSSWNEILAFLNDDGSYAEEFHALWSGGVTEKNVRHAIATFERTLLTPDSPFDHFLIGHVDAITQEAREGYQLFLDVGCISCHQGVNVGGNLFQRFGIASNFFEDRGAIKESDLGRYNLTQRDQDAFKFRVPSLRNVARTAPYFHDGSVPTLAGAVRIMAKYQLGASLDDGEVDKIVAFLETLTGEQQD